MLAASPEVTYIQEPFHPQHDKRVFSANTPYFYTYVCSSNEELIHKALRATLRFKRGIGSIHQWLRHPRGELLCQARALGDRLTRKRALLKDPLAFFSADWLYRQFDTVNIITIRHPAAFAYSLKKKQWRFSFENLLEQPELLRDKLDLFRKDIVEMSRRSTTVVEQAGILWKIIYYNVLEYKKVYPEWIYIRHEDISLQPLSEFEVLFEQLGLTFDGQVERIIRTHTESGVRNSRNSTIVIPDVARDSVKNIRRWKRELSQEESDMVRLLTQDVADCFYSSAEW